MPVSKLIAFLPTVFLPLVHLLHNLQLLQLLPQRVEFEPSGGGCGEKFLRRRETDSLLVYRIIFRSWLRDWELCFVRSYILINRLLVRVASVLQEGRLRHTAVYTGWSLVVLPAALITTALLLPSIYRILWYKVWFVTTGLLPVLWSCIKLDPILEGTLHASIFIVVLAFVLVPSLELSADDLHTDELLTSFVRILTEVFVVRHIAAEGTCELIDDDIDYCNV